MQLIVGRSRETKGAAGLQSRGHKAGMGMLGSPWLGEHQRLVAVGGRCARLPPLHALYRVHQVLHSSTKQRGWFQAVSSTRESILLPSAPAFARMRSCSVAETAAPQAMPLMAAPCCTLAKLVSPSVPSDHGHSGPTIDIKPTEPLKLRGRFIKKCTEEGIAEPFSTASRS